MSSTLSRNFLFSIEPFKLSNNSVFSIEEYNHINNKRCHVESNDDVGQSSNSLFSIEPFNLGRLRNNKVVTNHEDSSLCNVDEDCVNKPLNFQRVPRRVLKDIIFCVRIAKLHLIYASHVVGIFVFQNLERQT